MPCGTSCWSGRTKQDAAGDSEPPLGLSDRAAEGPASLAVRGSKQFAATGRAVELAARARREMAL